MVFTGTSQGWESTRSTAGTPTPYSVIRPTSTRAIARSSWTIPRIIRRGVTRWLTTCVLKTSTFPKKHAFNPHSDGVCLAFSPNGTDWTPYDGNPIFESWGGDVEMLTYDAVDKKYIIYGRYGGQSGPSPHPEHDSWFAPVIPSQPEGIWGTRRRVYRTESSDCLNWSMPELLFEPGHSDNLDDSHYGFMSWRAGDLHLGFLTVLHQVKNDMDFYLLYSRDGLKWSRLADHRPFVSRGLEGTYDCFGAELSNSSA